ncbi:uncharacterized protein LOC118370513 isoform X2 [Oncorhynchus keta]|uniref:uncharacterized protein LOC118370513 isoform X2 n=1 Tax=Oncorhynchus keta TaxID=8018 RepID=UPI00227BCEEE|nr:uncharacterized protein LOC118370513 isoform X2 [Oncorhynchus keta]
MKSSNDFVICRQRSEVGAPNNRSSTYWIRITPLEFSAQPDRLRLSLRPVTSTVTTNPAFLSPSTLSPNLQSLGPDCDSGAQFALQDPEMASVKLEDCSQTLELNVNIKDEEEEEKIGKSVSRGRLELCLRPVTSTVRTNPVCLSPSTLSSNLQSLGPDYDSGAQFSLQDPEMASVKLEDCSQTLELNVNIKDEEEEEKIGTSVSHDFCVMKYFFMSRGRLPDPGKWVLERKTAKLRGAGRSGSN